MAAAIAAVEAIQAIQAITRSERAADEGMRQCQNEN
jgi:hypothetical protein